MVVISLTFLLVYLFGAYAHGAATVFSLRKAHSLWARHVREQAAGGHWPVDRPSLTLFALGTFWFVLHTIIEFRNLTVAGPGYDVFDLATLLVYLYPPVIMHVVYNESTCDGETVPPPAARRLLWLMYALSPAIGLYTVGMIFGLVPRPDNFGPWIGGSIGGLFTLASLYSTALMLRRPRRTASGDQLRLRNVMIFLFIAMSGVFIALIFMREQGLLVAILERITRSAPLYFLVASVYFESRFEFYDLVVKRGLILLVSIVLLGGYFAILLPSLERLPASGARPWLFAVALVPLAMFLPLLMTRLETWLDRMWLGREFTPVEAVKHVLAAMQPAIDEASLIAAAEARLSEIFGAQIAVLVGSRAVLEPAAHTEIKLTSPVSGAIVRIVVVKEQGSRRFLSEDLALLRTLGGVFGFMLENIRLQRKRIEQEQLAQDLRLQSSKSELKALRAQINPHFLFNALNAIASLIHSDPARADEVVEQLAEVFRYTLRRSDSEWAPLDHELAFARAYLDVEQARFGQRLTFSIDSDHTLPAPQIPSMLLQTLLENAVKHGVSQAREPGRIEVIVRSTTDRLTLEVRNTGPAHSTRDLENAAARAGHAAAGTRDGEGFGLHSVRERLKGHFGDRASFQLTRDESAGVTVARIDMPNVRAAA